MWFLYLLTLWSATFQRCGDEIPTSNVQSTNWIPPCVYEDADDIITLDDEVTDNENFLNTLHNNYDVEKYIQVIDTPGILNRNYESRNNIEKLTFSVLDNTSSAIVFVMDLSEFGLKIKEQLEIRDEIQKRYLIHTDDNNNKNKNRVWIDVVSKFDIIEESLIFDVEQKIGNKLHPTSAEEIIGIDELRLQLIEKCTF